MNVIFLNNLRYKKILTSVVYTLFVFVVLFFSFSSNVFAVSKGDAITSATAVGTRFFALRSVNDQSAQSNRATWDLNVGNSITLYYKEWTSGASAPPTAETVTLAIYDDDTGTLETTLYSGAPPADGTSYSFSPSDAGTYRLYVAASCSTSPFPCTTTYDIDSDSSGGDGAVRANIKITDITKNAYPSGSKYVYGTASDENMTFTVSHSTSNSGGVKTVRLNTHHDNQSTIENGTTETIGTSSTEESFVADDTYENDPDTDHNVEFEIVGNSSLTGEVWTAMADAGHGGSVTRISDTVVRYDDRFVIDPRVYFDTDGTSSGDADNDVTTDESVYNRGETVTYDFYLMNARDEQVTRSMTVKVLAADDSTEDSQSKSGPNYSGTYVIANDDEAEDNTTGDIHTFQVSNTDQEKESDDAHGVSSQIRIGTTQAGTDNDVNTEETIYNRGESVSNINFYLTNARGEAYASESNITVDIIDSDSVSEDNQTSKSTDANGLLTLSDYTIASGDKAVADATGSAKRIQVSFPTSGNTTETSGTAHSVSSLYYVDTHPQITSTLSKDDFDTQDSEEDLSAVIAADVMSFFVHVEGVRKDDTEIDTSGSVITLDLDNPSGTNIQSVTGDTGSDGWTSSLLDYAAVAPSGTWNAETTVSFNGNSGTDSEDVTFISPYAGNYQIDAVGWNQTYNLGDTAIFTIQTQQYDSVNSEFDPINSDSVPTYTLRYWDDDLSQWISIASGTTTQDTTGGLVGTYEATYDIPDTLAWAGRKIAASFSSVINGTRINKSEEVEIVSSPAQVIINSITDNTVPTITADVTITNEGTATFEYHYEWCVVENSTNQCGGGDDVAYSSAAKLIAPGNDFDTNLTLNVVDSGDYYFKVAVWWTAESSKANTAFTATETTSGSLGSSGSSDGGGRTNDSIDDEQYISLDTQEVSKESTFAAVWKKISEMLNRIVNFESRLNRLESRVIVLESKVGLGGLPLQQVFPRQNIQVPKIQPNSQQIQKKKDLFRIRFK